MLNRFRLIAVALFALVLTGCATMLVSSHSDPAINFRQYRTFDWGPADSLPTGDPRLDNNPFFHDAIKGAVERQLAGKGLTLTATPGSADLLIHYHANVTQRIRVSEPTSDQDRAQTFEYEEGTLVLDFVDSKTGNVVWRGWARDSVDGVIDDQDRLNRKVGEAVSGMMDRFPPR